MTQTLEWTGSFGILLSKNGREGQDTPGLLFAHPSLFSSPSYLSLNYVRPVVVILDQYLEFRICFFRKKERTWSG
jgi:hypothetical protein